MKPNPTTPPLKPTDESPDEWRADVCRRRAEAADVLAETLLEMWLGERRAQRQGQRTSPPEGGRHD